YVMPKLQIWANFFSPIICIASVVVYVIIIVKVRRNLVQDSANRSFFRCVSRLTVVTFTICMAEFILPISRIVEEAVRIASRNSSTREEIFAPIWNTIALFVSNSIGVWMFI
ncbi:hypothetical protein PMAYCL1PPCAC_10436, partial [Pristionchus mayeri]